MSEGSVAGALSRRIAAVSENIVYAHHIGGQLRQCGGIQVDYAAAADMVRMAGMIAEESVAAEPYPRPS